MRTSIATTAIVLATTVTAIPSDVSAIAEAAKAFAAGGFKSVAEGVDAGIKIERSDTKRANVKDGVPLLVAVGLKRDNVNDGKDCDNSLCSCGPGTGRDCTDEEVHYKDCQDHACTTTNLEDAGLSKGGGGCCVM